MAALRLRSGETIEDRRDGSHLPPALKALLPEVLSRISADQIDPNGDGVEVDFGRIVGVTNLVATNHTDDVVFARRPGRKGLTRFVRNREGTPTSRVVLILRPTGRGGYFVVTGWFGRLAQPEPFDRHAKPGSIPFWSTHALIWGSALTVPGTETKVCPWTIAGGSRRPRAQES